MRLDGIHHITAITADAPRNVDFYARVLGLRLVKKTVNQDDPTVYHLFYADEDADPGADLTFFEYPGARRGRPGAGMVHRVVWRVGSAEALDFWAERLGDEGTATERDGDALRFSDPEGMGLELAVSRVEDRPLSARSVEVPDEYALQGFDGVRAYAAGLEGSERLLHDVLAFEPAGEGAFETRGPARSGWIAYDRASARGVPGAGTVHHVAWSAADDEQESWRRLVVEAGLQPTPVIDRFYFKSVYFREPSGVLFELATPGPGFAVDEPLETLGEGLSLPPQYESLRERLEQVLTPLPDTRPWRRGREGAAASAGERGAS